MLVIVILVQAEVTWLLVKLGRLAHRQPQPSIYIVRYGDGAMKGKTDLGQPM